MKIFLTITVVILFIATRLLDQLAAGGGTWKTCFITPGTTSQLPPPSSKKEFTQDISLKQGFNSEGLQQINYRNTSAHGYRWQDVYTLWTINTGKNGGIANLLPGADTNDATIAAWNTRYANSNQRSFSADQRLVIVPHGPESNSYLFEHSIVAGIAELSFPLFIILWLIL